MRPVWPLEEARCEVRIAGRRGNKVDVREVWVRAQEGRVREYDVWRRKWCVDGEMRAEMLRVPVRGVFQRMRRGVEWWVNAERGMPWWGPWR